MLENPGCPRMTAAGWEQRRQKSPVERHRVQELRVAVQAEASCTNVRPPAVKPQIYTSRKSFSRSNPRNPDHTTTGSRAKSDPD